MKKGMLQPVGEEYEDIIHLPHPVSKHHPQMALEDRAAQFSPFAALTGHEAAIQETQRLTEREVRLDENVLEKLNEKWQWIETHLSQQPEITFTCFIPDEKKDGGSYRQVTGHVKKINWYEKRIVLAEAGSLEIGHIVEMDSLLWENVEF